MLKQLKLLFCSSLASYANTIQEHHHHPPKKYKKKILKKRVVMASSLFNLYKTVNQRKSRRKTTFNYPIHLFGN